MKIKLSNIIKEVLTESNNLSEELRPEKGHMGGISNTLDLRGLIDWNGVDVDKFKEFLDGSEIGYEPSDSALDMYQSIQRGAPEAFYWLWRHKPGDLKIKPLIKKEGYVLYTAKKGYGNYMDHILVDEANGQILGKITANTNDFYKKYFGVAPWQVSLSEMVPSVRGTGEGKIMYLMFLEARQAIVSDSTLYEGSFAMWDTQIRASTKYSGVIMQGGFPIINKNDSVYDMAIPNEMLESFFASNTIASWIVKYSNKLNSLPVNDCFYVQVISNDYNAKSFYEVLDALAEEADAKTIVDALMGNIHGKRRGRLDPEVNKYIRLSRENWNSETWSEPGRVNGAGHIIVALTDDSYDPPVAIYDIDLTLAEPEVKIL